MYGVTGAEAEAPAGPGVDTAHAVTVIRHAGLAAIVSRIAGGASAVDAALEDLDRLEALARAHAAVLDQALAQGPVLPFRMGTVFANADGVRAMLDERRAAFASALRSLRGRSEWGVKVYARRRRAREPVATPPASGTDYLTRRRIERETAERARQDVLALLDAIHAQLQERAEDSALLTAHSPDLVLNAVYLVTDAAAVPFAALAEQLASEARRQGLRLDLTGPWPAYHFTALEA